MDEVFGGFLKNTIAGFVALAIVVSSCSKKDTTSPEDEAPSIPPISSFVIDFSDFTSTGPLSKPGHLDKILTTRNWGWAAGNVVVWNTVLTVTLAVPVAAFVESFKHEPVRMPDGSWVWSYDFEVFEIPHSASLHGTIDNGEVHWDMYISKQGAYTDFHWYTGNSDFLATEGTWTLSMNPDDPMPFLDIVWHRDLQNASGDIKYTNIIPDDPGNGGYISHGASNRTHDAFYIIYHKVVDNHTEIEWNRISKEGRLRDTLHFGDADWRCWDGQLQDRDCP
jgi:hypothetical protein